MSDAGAWNKRYGGAGFTFGEAPNLYLQAQEARLRRGQNALAIGDGEGRNGVWLAQRGLAVTSLDWSAIGLQKAEALAAARGVLLRTECADMLRWHWPAAKFDLIAWIFVHLPPADRVEVARQVTASLRPGGLLVFEAFAPAQEGRRSGGPQDPALLPTGVELRTLFNGLELLECLEGTVRLDEGPRHQGEAEVVRGLWRRSLARAADEVQEC